MKQKHFSIGYFNKETNTLLECRQCSHLSEWQASHEAELYAAWAEYHYKCKVVYRIKEQ